LSGKAAPGGLKPLLPVSESPPPRGGVAIEEQTYVPVHAGSLGNRQKELLGANGNLRYELARGQRKRTQQLQLLGRSGKNGARPLRWEEASLSMLPLGEVIVAIVEESRPYGIFVSLVVTRQTSCGPGRNHVVMCEDSLIRGFCSRAQLEEARMSKDVIAQIPKGTEVAVKLLHVDNNQRLHVAYASEPKDLRAKIGVKMVSPLDRMLGARLRTSQPSDPEAERLLGG